MKLTFLAHSGFLIETDCHYLLFDWWKGALQALSGKALLCFASHRHEDHFSTQIFGLDDGTRQVTFLLGKDIKLTERHLQKWGVSPATAAKCRSLGGNQRVEIDGVTVEALPSTDEGVAFLVTVDGKTIYHAGDLNWWHWNGEDEGWNRNMAVNFQRYIEPLRSRHIDLAMVPLDPRQEDAEDWGARYLLEIAEVRHVAPMHQWEDFSPTDRFRTAYPQWASRLLPIAENGQSFELT